MTEQPQNRKDAERRLIERASQDAGFRAALLDNPKEVVAREFDIVDIPDDLVIRVMEETPGEIIIVLPPDLSEGTSSSPDRLRTNTKWIFF